MADDVIYVILGAELQGKIHYVMPVKNSLYDAIGYSNLTKNGHAQIAMINMKELDEMERELARFTGFTEEEVEELCRQYDMSFEETKRWI